MDRLPRRIRQATRIVLVGYATGLVGTALMTATTWAQERLRSTTDVPVDYDATRHVVTAASSVLRFHPEDQRQARALFALTHWGYGSAVAVAHRALVRRTSRPRAAAVLFLGSQTMALVLFPTMGGTPPPWRWRRDVLASSLAQHAVYALGVAAVDAAISGPVRPVDFVRARIPAWGGSGVLVGVGRQGR